MNAKILSLICFLLDSPTTMANNVGNDETQKGKVIDSRTHLVKGLGLATPHMISEHSSYMA